MQRFRRLARLVVMQGRLVLVCAFLVFGACTAQTMDAREGAPIAPRESTAKEPRRLWVSGQKGGSSVRGYVEASGTGNSIHYDLQTVGLIDSMIIGGRDGSLLAQSGGPLRGESVFTGYLDVPEGSDAVTALFRRPHWFHLSVAFKGDGGLRAAFSRRRVVPFAQVWYSLDIEREGRPAGAYSRRPRGIDVRYWDATAARWVRVQGVSADWAVTLHGLDPGDRVELIARAESGGALPCSAEISYLRTASGETFTRVGRDSCHVRATVGGS